MIPLGRLYVHIRFDRSSRAWDDWVPSQLRLRYLLVFQISISAMCVHVLESYLLWGWV